MASMQQNVKPFSLLGYLNFIIPLNGYDHETGALSFHPGKFLALPIKDTLHHALPIRKINRN